MEGLYHTLVISGVLLLMVGLVLGTLNARSGSINILPYLLITIGVGAMMIAAVIRIKKLDRKD